MGRNEVECTRKVETRNFWQLPKHAWLYSDLLQASKGEPVTAPGSQQRGDLNFCVRIAPPRGLGERDEHGNDDGDDDDDLTNLLTYLNPDRTFKI